MQTGERDFPTAERVETAVAALAGPGWGVIDDFLPSSLWQALADSAQRRLAAGEFRAASIGRGGRVQTVIRGDTIRWLEAGDADAAERDFFTLVERLRQAINRRLWLGLLDFECHYARYPAGARYRRHLDRPHRRTERTVTLVCYLNAGWRAEEGGALRLYLDEDRSVEVLPQGGRAVVFLSERFEHEVLPARRPRLALTGWYRQRLHGGRVI
ncbi:SM-20-related protein [Methylomarinovum caldicuralii]|uniref:SM-20-related protein n=1 Tax=Methylomarinovum caldicuralii TaxID=438856 RepID=A0AAU9C2Q2_9GAMM|nr:2OG-Fe(II) oxygenase [Methylomarinovum caldicuralii]BCX81450.1 SM-20-related protein [Methylomarinovum caldicuralii]